MNLTIKLRNPWPVAIIAYFIVFATFIGSFIVFAVRQKMDLVGSDYYDQEMRYQQRLDRLNLTRSLNAEISITPEANRTITLSLAPAHAHQAASGTIRLYRPSDASLDQEIPLKANAKGVQQIDTSKLKPGLWRARINWRVNEAEFFSDQSIIIGPH